MEAVEKKLSECFDFWNYRSCRKSNSCRKEAGQEAGQNIRRTILLEEGPDSSMMQIQYLKGRYIVESS